MKIKKIKNDKFLKLVSLIVLFVQSTSMVLFMRATRTRKSGPLYISSTVVLLAEILKVICSLAICFWEKKFKWKDTLLLLKHEIFFDTKGALHISIPALLYAIQNNILFVALSNLDAAIFQILYQMKILTTALFSVILLKRRLSKPKQFALILLFLGAIFVQQHNNADNKPDLNLNKHQNSNQVLGLFAVILACFTSGFAGVYFEKILKGYRSSIQIRNIQLGVFGTLFSALIMFYNDRKELLENGFFYGQTPSVCQVVINNALGGLVVALVVKYADNIIKGFALSLSIILSSLISSLQMNFRPGFKFIFGASLVILATIMYGSVGNNLSINSSNKKSERKVVNSRSKMSHRLSV